MKERLDPKLWSELEATYVGAGLEENWQALFRTIDVSCAVAVQVGRALGYAYPHDLDRRVVAYLRRVQELSPNATSFD